MKKRKKIVAVAGASGFVGQHLIKELVKRGYGVVGLSRQDRKDHNTDNIEWRRCDIFSGSDIRKALRCVDIAVYLVHSMLPTARLRQGTFFDYDLVLADNFSQAAKLNGLEQIIYLGGIIPAGSTLSKHLVSRHDVGKTLLASGVPLTTLRAGIVLGPKGSSFRIMYNLVKRLPIMISPSWASSLSSPISVEDTVASILHCTENKNAYYRKYDIGGGSTLSYVDMMRVLGQKLGKKSVILTSPIFSPYLSKKWISAISGAPKELVYPLVDSLKSHMVPSVHRKLEIPDYRFENFEDTIDRILDQDEKLEQKPTAFKQSERRVSVNKVHSVQRLDTLYHYTAKDISKIYFEWLPKFYAPFIDVKQENGAVCFYIRGIKQPLMTLRRKDTFCNERYQSYSIEPSLLSSDAGGDRGRLTFRTIFNDRYTMVEVHEYVPSLPWYVYKYTQAILHKFTVKAFARYILYRYSKDGIKSLEQAS